MFICRYYSFIHAQSILIFKSFVIFLNCYGSIVNTALTYVFCYGLSNGGSATCGGMWEMIDLHG